MARLPSNRYCIQLVGADIVLFDDVMQEDVLTFPAQGGSELAKAQKAISEYPMSTEDRAFAHFWCGYFYACTCRTSGCLA